MEARLSKFRDLLPDFVAACSPVTRIEILRPDATIHRVEGIIHPQFELLLKLATSRDAAQSRSRYFHRGGSVERQDNGL